MSISATLDRNLLGKMVSSDCMPSSVLMRRMGDLGCGMWDRRVGLILEEDLAVARQHIFVLRLGQPSYPAGYCLLYLNIFLLLLS